MTMRRWATWLLVGGLAALSAVAVADALRGEPTTRKADSPTISVALIPRNEPAASAISGVLYYSAENDECRLNGIRLPGLENAPPPKLRSCRFSISPTGANALPGSAAWSRDGRFFAREMGAVVEFNSIATESGVRLRGHAPAFKPDGTFTYARGNDIVECPREEPISPCRKVVARFGDWSVLELAWLTNSRMAVIARPSDYVLVIREGRLRVSVPGWGRPVTDLEASPQGSFVAVRARGREGLIVFGADGRTVSLPPFADTHSITWSPDERWTAVATRRSVFIFRTNTGEARVRRLPIVARELAWR
jgi:hypothetical protein